MTQISRPKSFTFCGRCWWSQEDEKKIFKQRHEELMRWKQRFDEAQKGPAAHAVNQTYGHIICNLGWPGECEWDITAPSPYYTACVIYFDSHCFSVGILLFIRVHYSLFLLHHYNQTACHSYFKNSIAKWFSTMLSKPTRYITNIRAMGSKIKPTSISV